MSRYKVAAIEKFKNRRIESTSPEERFAQINRAENLLGELDPDKTYRFSDLSRRVAGERSDSGPRLAVRGKDALHDLRLFVEDLSESLSLPADGMGEPVLSVQELSRRYNVSTKTVDRWRNRGLASRKFRFGNRTGIGFLKSSVERFVARRPEEVRRGARFSQMTPQEREAIVEEARRLARAGKSASQISRTLADQFGRSAETIRYTVKKHDEKHPHAAVHGNASAAMTSEMKQEIYRRYRRGVPVERLSGTFGRSRGAIERIITAVRTEKLRDLPIDYIDNEEFRAKDAGDVILGPVPEDAKKQRLTRPPAGLPSYLASLYEQPLLTRQQEAYYFRKMNYLKYRAAQLRDELVETGRVRRKDLDRIEELLDETNRVRNLLIRRNLRLVVSVVKKYARTGDNFFELVSDGNESLMRAIDKFDYGRGFKLSTYATWAITKNFARSIPQEHTRLKRFRTGTDEVFLDFREDERSNAYEQERNNQRQRELLVDMLKQLSERDREIIVSRFGLREGAEPQTLEEIGREQGVSKERVRQLESRALKKLRGIVEEEKLDIPGL